jgi:SAM-dependent methyltransferase
MVHSYSFKDMGVQLIPDDVRHDLLTDGYRENGKYLNLGCGKEYYTEPGWINLDGCVDIKADVYCDIDKKDLKMPFKDGEFDIIFASHIFEHIWYLRDLKLELARITKSGGQLTFVVPYYTFADAWGDDTHCRAFSESSIASFLWPGFDMGHYGYLPTINQSPEGKPVSEYWLWASKPKLA